MVTVSSISSRARFWPTVLLYGFLYFVVMSLGAFVVEPLSGGCMFVIPTYFMALVVVLPILLLQRFGAGMAVFLLYAVLGFFPEYYMEWVSARNLISPWGAVGWSLMGPLAGLAADLAYRFTPDSVPERWRSVIVGAVFGAAAFLTTYIALTTFYATQSPESHYRFFSSGVYFSLPWMIANGGFAGYTAYALSKRV